MTSRFWIAAALVLLACNAKANATPRIGLEWLSDTRHGAVYTFKRGSVRCFIVESSFSSAGQAISCVTEEK